MSATDPARADQQLRGGLDFGSQPKLLWKTAWDVDQLTPSPHGHYLALGPDISDANAWIISGFPLK